MANFMHLLLKKGHEQEYKKPLKMYFIFLYITIFSSEQGMLKPTHLELL